MKDLFREQLENNQPVTGDVIDKLHNSKYFNGDSVEIEDVMLLGMIRGEPIQRPNEITQIPLHLIKLNERHFHLFDTYERNWLDGNNQIPILKFKKEHEKLFSKYFGNE
jgi:hypothetical protein